MVLAVGLIALGIALLAAGFSIKTLRTV